VARTSPSENPSETFPALRLRLTDDRLLSSIIDAALWDRDQEGGRRSRSNSAVAGEREAGSSEEREREACLQFLTTADTPAGLAPVLVKRLQPFRRFASPQAISLDAAAKEGDARDALALLEHEFVSSEFVQGMRRFATTGPSRVLATAARAEQTEKKVVKKDLGLALLAIGKKKAAAAPAAAAGDERTNNEQGEHEGTDASAANEQRVKDDKEGRARVQQRFDFLLRAFFEALTGLREAAAYWRALSTASSFSRNW